MEKAERFSAVVLAGHKGLGFEVPFDLRSCECDILSLTAVLFICYSLKDFTT